MLLSDPSSLLIRQSQGVTKRCLSWLTNSTLVYEPKWGGGGGVARSQPKSTAGHINFGVITSYLTYGQSHSGQNGTFHFLRISYGGWDLAELRMRSSLVVGGSDCQCTSCNGPGFDPSIRRHGGIWGAADEAVLNIIRLKNKKSPPQKIKK